MRSPEPQSRLVKIGDAFSQLCQVTFFRRHEDSDAHESMSGRCFWESEFGRHAGHWSWRWARAFIDTLFWSDREGDKRHCELADERDYRRAQHKIRVYEARPPRGRST